MIRKISCFSQIKQFHLKSWRFYEIFYLNKLDQLKKQEIINFFEKNDCQLNLITSSFNFLSCNFHLVENELFFLEESKELIFS